MSDAYLCTEKDGISGFPNIGFSSDSNKSTKLFAKAIGALRNTISMGRPYADTIELLNSVFTESSEENWDGYDALPVTANAYWEARSLIEMLPSNLKMPDILGGTDGEIILEWYRDSRRLFAISITGKNELIFAGLIGPNSIRGTTYFGDSIPEEIIKYIQKIK